MKVDLTKVLFNEDGENFKKEGGKDWTFRDVFTTCLLNEIKDQEATPEDKGKRFTLWYEKIKDKKEAELSLEEQVMIKERVGKMFPAIVYGQISLILK